MVYPIVKSNTVSFSSVNSLKKYLPILLATKSSYLLKNTQPQLSAPSNWINCVHTAFTFSMCLHTCVSLFVSLMSPLVWQYWDIEDNLMKDVPLCLAKLSTAVSYRSCWLCLINQRKQMLQFNQTVFPLYHLSCSFNASSLCNDAVFCKVVATLIATPTLFLSACTHSKHLSENINTGQFCCRFMTTANILCQRRKWCDVLLVQCRHREEFEVEDKVFDHKCCDWPAKLSWQARQKCQNVY